MSRAATFGLDLASMARPAFGAGLWADYGDLVRFDGIAATVAGGFV